MANHYKLGEDTVETRNRLLRSMSQKPKTEKNMRWSLKILRSSIHHHLTCLINEGYVKRTKIEVDGRMQYTYEAIRPEYIDTRPENPAKPKKSKSEFYNPFRLSYIDHKCSPKVIIQQDKVKWTKLEKQHMEVRRGSTLGSMTF